MKLITWLHLSDLHFKSGKEYETFNRYIVLKSLWSDIETQLDKGLKPDFMVISGDIAYHGKSEQYELTIKDFFDPLLKITKLSKDNLFIVPGNHDVDWRKISTGVADEMINLLQDRDQINQFLSREQNRTYFFKKFEGYSGFVNNYFAGSLNFSDANYFYQRTLEIHESKICIFGLNSAWMCGCHKDSKNKVDDQGKLLIGERQLEEALEEGKDADLRIAVFHHPTDWLHDIDRFNVEKRLESECDIVLHGHWHKPHVKDVRSIAGSAIYIPCGSVYGDKERNSLNGYNFVQFDLDSRKGKIYLRRYNDDGPNGAEWMKDTISTRDKQDGIYEFEINSEKNPLSNVSRQKPAVLFEQIAQQLNRAEIRQLLNTVFDDAGLTAFCMDYFEEVYDKLSEGMQKTQKLTILIKYCSTPQRLNKLFEGIYDCNPSEFSDFVNNREI